MKKIYLLTFLTLLLAKYTYASARAKNSVFFDMKQEQMTSKPQSPEGQLSENNGMLLFGNSEQFFFTDQEVRVDVEDVCTYTTSYTSSTKKFEKNFVLKSIIKRTNCEEPQFNGVVTHTLTRIDGSLIYHNKFVDTNAKTVSEFSCKYQK